jgi:isoleucyl-tRNA synthetase
LNVLVSQVDELMEGYNPTDAGRRIQDFIDGLSNWYVRRSRRRFWKSENDDDKLSAYATLYECLVTISRLMAPLAPFMAEEMYQNLVRAADQAAPDSVHLSQFPVADESLVDEELMSATRLAMRISSMGRAARSRAGIKVRQPLAEVTVWGHPGYLEQVRPQVLEELNIKEMRVLGEYEGEAEALSRRAEALAIEQGKAFSSNEGLYQVDQYWMALGPGCMVAIDATVTPELAEEGLAREIAHRIQNLRRNAKFELTDRIVTYYQAPEEIDRVMHNYAEYISQETLSEELVLGTPENGAATETQKVEGMEVTLSVVRV